MFSDRSTWDLKPNALSVLLQDKQSKGEKIFDLTQSNPTRAGFDYDVPDILAALVQPQTMDYQPDSRGLPQARQAIVQYYRQRGQHLDIDAIFLTPGTSEAYSMLFKLLGNPGDEILVPRPGYPLLSYLARFEGLQPCSYPLRYDDLKGWFIDLEVLDAIITAKTRTLICVNPNNPTGSYISAGELAAIDELCRRHDLALIVDEVFCEFDTAAAPDRVQTVVNHTTSLTFVLNGLSKMAGLPQLKVGWIAVGGDPLAAKKASARLEMLLDFYLGVSGPSQLAVAAVLQRRAGIHRQMIARITANSRSLENQLGRASNARVLHRQGGWYAIIEICDDLSDEDRILQLLKHDNTLVHPGYFYEFQGEGFVIVSLLPPIETFQTGISRLITRFKRG